MSIQLKYFLMYEGLFKLPRLREWRYFIGLMKKKKKNTSLPLIMFPAYSQLFGNHAHMLATPHKKQTDAFFSITLKLIPLLI